MFIIILALFNYFDLFITFDHQLCFCFAYFDCNFSDTVTKLLDKKTIFSHAVMTQMMHGGIVILFLSPRH